MRRLDGITDAMRMNLGKLWEMGRDKGVVCCSPWGHKELDVTGRLSNNIISKCHSVCVCVCIGAIIDNSNKIPCFTKQSSQKIISFLDERVINTHTGQGAIS